MSQPQSSTAPDISTAESPGPATGNVRTPAGASAPTKAAFVPLLQREFGRWQSVVWFALAWAILIAIWEVGALTGAFSARILPPPSETVPFLLSGGAEVGFGTQRTGLFDAVGITLGRIAVGLVLGLAASIAIGFLIVQVLPCRRVLLPIVQTLAPISPVAWIPFAIAIVGIGDPAALFVVFMAVFGSMCCAAVAAFDSVPDEYRKVAKSLGADTIRLWTTVLLPAAAPGLMTMVRMSLFAAWMAVLAGEMAGINSGLGYLIIQGQQMYNMELVMVGVIAIGLVGFTLDRFLLLAQRKLIWWEDA